MSQGISRRGVMAGAAGALAMAGLPSGARAQAGAKPNIIYIMADDMGYADLGCFGSVSNKTPVIDRLAAEGMRLTHAYANSSVCSPTRVGLLSGRYQYRLPVGLDEPGNITGQFPPSHPTIASLIRMQDYYTVLVGKWHLGTLPDTSPTMCGYDTFFGIFAGGADYFTHRFGDAGLYEGEVPVERIGYMTDLLGDRAVDEINKAADMARPIFMSLHFTAPHWPWEGPEDEAVSKRLNGRIQHYDGGSLETYAAMVKSLDDNVGKVLKVLDDRGLADNTIVIFTSDNGGERFSNTWPFIGMKAELLEGGIRVPAIVRWPGRIRAGSVSSQVAMSMDWLPTLVAAAGGTPDPRYPSDGMTLLPQLTQGAAPAERTVYWRFKANEQKAIRRGPWKYLLLGGQEWLFNVVADPRERGNRKDREPEIFEDLKARWEAWNTTMLPYPAGSYSYSQEGHVADRY